MLSVGVERVCDGYRFECFEVRVNARVLLCRGKLVKIQELPFRMLVALLERPGQVVSREELRVRLWDQRTFVEFDSGLRVAAAKLREALGDKVTEPQYVATISGRGYCFIADVEPFDIPAKEQPHVEEYPVGVIAVGAEQEPAASVTQNSWIWYAIFTALAVVLSAAGVFWYRHQSRPLVSTTDRIVFGGFANRTGDPAYDGVLAPALRVKLEESPYLTLVPEAKFQRLLKNASTASMKEGLQACSSLNGAVLLRGEILSEKSGYQLAVTAWRCSDGRLVATEKAAADSQTGVLPALDLATEKMRRRLGESSASLQKFNIPLMQATTGSLAALRAFSRGEEKHIAGLGLSAVSDYKLATDLDPQFALAYARLGTIYSNAGEFSLSQPYYQKAFQLRERTTDREKLYIVSHYYAYATGEIFRAMEAYKLWHTMYPRDIIPVNNLATLYIVAGDPQKALEMAQAAVRLDPTISSGYAVEATAYSKAGDYKELHALCNDPAHKSSNATGFHLACFVGAFGQNDAAGMDRELQWSQSSPQGSAILDVQGSIAMSRGQMALARRIFSEARKSAMENNLSEFAAAIDLDDANFEADIGADRQARQAALDALREAPDSLQIQAFAALALARSGDVTRAEALAEAVAARSPLDTILNTAELGAVRAAIKLQQHSPDAAVKALEDARPFDYSAFMGLATGYYRGLAYLEGNHPQEAAREFQNVLDHRNIAITSPYVVLSQLELGRTLQLLGDAPAAARTYKDVEAAWQNADQDFPPLLQLRAYQRELQNQGQGQARM